MPPQLERKAYDGDVEVKDADKGVVECVVSVFGNEDSDGDVMEKGAFSTDLKRGKERGKLPPGVWAHDWKLPVAKTMDAWEAADGLHVTAQFNLDTQRGRETFSDIKAGIITEFSFGFRVREHERKGGRRHITDVEWFEWSPVLVGANRDTYVASVKEQKAAVLGPYVEAEMSLAALRSLNEALFYQVVYQCLYDTSASLAERLDTLRAGFAEFGDLALRTLEMLLEDGDAEKSAASVRTLWPETKTLTAEALLAGDSLQSNSEAVLAAAKEQTRRYRALKDLCAKEGKPLSSARRARILAIHEGLGQMTELLAELLAETEPKTEPKANVAAEEAFLRAQARYQSTLARLSGVPVS